MIRVDRKLNSTDVLDALTDLFILRGPPEYIRSPSHACEHALPGNGQWPGIYCPESSGLDRGGWGQDGLHRARITPLGTSSRDALPGNAWENGSCESFNARFRDELLNCELFHSLRGAQILIEQWRVHSNAVRPHSISGYRSPAPESIVPMDQRPTMHSQLTRTTRWGHATDRGSGAMKDATFSSARLLALYDRISDADDAIPRLRRFVLDLAVRGKLGEQDLTDEPAAELLERIAQEKARLVKAKEIKKSEVESVTHDEEPYVLPRNRAWTRLGSIGDWGAGSTPSRGNSELYGGAMTWLKSGELNDNTALAGSEETVTEIAVKKGSFRVNKPGDVLIAMYGATIGKLAILAETAVTNQAVCGCTPFDGVANRFLFLFLLAYRVKFHAASEGGAQPNISKVKIVGTPFSLPPLAEQHRIVTKVDELMALCNQLKQARAGREAVRDRLATASIARLSAPETDAQALPAKVGTGSASGNATDTSTFQSQARFALQSLTTRPDQMKTLRQTILNLAVRGKLVEQDPADEPAAELLKRIANERISGKALRKSKLKDLQDAEEVADSEAVPHGWVWARSRDLALEMRYGTSVKCDYDIEGVPVFRIANVSGGRISFDDMKLGPLSPKEVADLSLQAGDLLMIRSNGSLAVGISFAGYLVRLRTYPSVIDPHYVWLATNSSEVRDQIERPIRSAVGLKNVNLSEFGALAFRLPPRAEQYRILAKVDAMMALCDQLEASLTTAAATRSKLLDALLHEALEPTAEKEPA